MKLGLFHRKEEEEGGADVDSLTAIRRRILCFLGSIGEVNSSDSYMGGGRVLTIVK